MSANNDKFLKDVRRLLDESVEYLDASTVSRLNRARQRAQEEKTGSKSRLFILGSIPAAGLALILLLLLRPVVPLPQVVDPNLGDLHILTATEPLDFYQEEMEFYEWLAEVMENDKEFSDNRSLPADALAGRFPRGAGTGPGASGS